MSHINDGRDSSSLSPQLEGGMFTCHTEIRCSESLVLSNLSRAWDYSRRSLDAPDVSERIPELAFSIHRESHSWLSWQENLWFLLFPFRLLSSALLLCLTKGRTSRSPKGNTATRIYEQEKQYKLGDPQHARPTGLYAH